MTNLTKITFFSQIVLNQTKLGTYEAKRIQ